MGLNYGYGKTSLEGYGPVFIRPFDEDFNNYYRVGFSYFYSPNDDFFTLRTGIDYDNKDLYKSTLHFLKIPFGIDFVIGKKAQFILGAGLFASYLIADNGYFDNPRFYQTINKFQLAFYSNIGIGFQLSKNLNFSIKYQYNSDIIKFYEYKHTSPGGAPYTIPQKAMTDFCYSILSID